MSRYTVKTVKDGKEYEVAYGFDRPLQEYFLQVFDNSREEDDECIIWEGSRMTGKSNSEMCDLMLIWGVPKEHVSIVALDLPLGYTNDN